MEVEAYWVFWLLVVKYRYEAQMYGVNIIVNTTTYQVEPEHHVIVPPPITPPRPQ